jgi:two-component system, OmpR family, sensor histidine kinase CpxA
VSATISSHWTETAAEAPAVVRPPRERFWLSRKRLFIKVFFWFWLTMLLVLALLVGSIIQRNGTAPQIITLPDMWAGFSPVLAQAAIHAYEETGAAGYGQFCALILGNQERQLYLVDREGRDVLGRALPQNIKIIVQAARDQHHTLLQYGLTSKVAAYESYSPLGRRYVLVLSMPRTLGGSELPNGLRGAFIPAVLVTVTLLCLALARHIAGPIAGLSAAARRVSRGDLTARAPASAIKRRDELADLGADFNEMIERIQSLMSAHQELLASVSHELRSPLARLNLSLALLRKIGTSKQNTVISQMEQDVTRVDGLLTQLLTLSRLESGIAGAQRTEVDLSLLLQEIVADCNFEAEASTKSVYGDLGCTACLPCADADALRSACENIVRNAVRFTKPGTAVRVALRREVTGSDVTIIVEDSGPGVPDKHLSRIFEPFFRAKENAGTHEGVGLGLAIATRAIHLHHGSISALNRKPSGLRVEVRLPTTG